MFSRELWAERKAECVCVYKELSPPPSLIFSTQCDGDEQRSHHHHSTTTTFPPPHLPATTGVSPRAPPPPHPPTLVPRSLLVPAPSIVSAGSNVCQVCWQAAANELAGVYIIFSGAPKSPPAGATRLTRLMTPDPLRHSPPGHLTSWEQWCQALLGHSSLAS